VSERAHQPPASGLDQLVQTWPVRTAAVAVVSRDGIGETAGALDQPLLWASVTKVLTALTAWIAVEEGTIALDDPAGPPGATVRHLLAHASGLALDRDTVLAAPGARRIYSNRGIEIVAEVVASRAALPFDTYLREAVLDPLGMRATRLDGSAASGAVGPVVDLARLTEELLRPTLVSAGTLALATTVAFPGLAGVLPGFGRQDPNDWGLGVELRGHKAPHWTPSTASPRTFGHFGRAGGFVWVDPDRGVGCACLSDEPFGAWAASAWPALGEAVLARR
jgi:CubicO group peptidase (beta-lactamase class C family)